MRLIPKVLFVSWIIALLPLAGVGWVLTGEMSALARRNALTAQESLARRTVDAVRLRMDRAVDLLSFLARLGDLTGPRAEQTLAAAMDSSAFFTDLWVYDPDGRPRAYFHRLENAPGIEKDQWPRVREQIQKRGSYTGPTEFQSRRSPRQMMAVLLPGNKGFLAGKMNLYLLSEDLAGLDLGTGGRVFILDQKGRMVAHSLSTSPRDFAPPVETTSPNEYPAWDGVRVLGVRFPVPGSDLQVLFEQPSSVAQNTAQRVKKRILTALVFGGIFAGVLALTLGAIVSRSLRELRHALAKMKEGQFDVLVQIDSRDEFGDLARTLAEAQVSLEKRVRDSVLGRLSRLIGHDMRQPIQAARTALETALRHLKEVDDVGIQHLRYCFDAFDQMDDYVEDILTVGRDRPPNRHIMNLNELAQNVIKSFRPPETMKLTTRWADGLPTCPVDEREARRALANAIKNAMEAAGPHGHVTVSSERQDNRFAVLQVEDDGPGLSEEKKERLFEEFTTKDGGNGLGFLVMKKVMAQHQGKLEVIDAPGHGLRVRFLFPI